MKFLHFTYLVFTAVFLNFCNATGILYPRPTETRELLSLDGIWQFALNNDSQPDLQGIQQEWREINLKDIDEMLMDVMPVPASYNDIGIGADLRDHVGFVWYKRTFFVPKSWKSQRVWIRFASVCRSAQVWVNDEWVASHDIGHLPFQAEITTQLNFGQENKIIVGVDNTLTPTSIPQGLLVPLISGRQKQTYTFDFFNYAGIDRPVVLYTTPQTYIDDITLTPTINNKDGILDFDISLGGSKNDNIFTKISLIDKENKVVATDTVLKDTMFIPNANFWWPYLMDPNPGYLYTFQIELTDGDGNLIDKYRLPVGIRELSWDSNSFKINNKSVYMRGFGRHEDSDIRGKGLDLALILRDYNLIKWIGANSYRTSHYPYAEEIMDLADELGIMNKSLFSKWLPPISVRVMGACALRSWRFILKV